MREGWEIKKLGEVCEIFDSLRKPVTKKDRKQGVYPYYGASGIQDYVDSYIFDGRYLLVGEDGAKWGAKDKSAYIIEGKSWVNNHVHILKPKDGIIDKLIEYYLVFKDLQAFITGAIVPKLTQQALKKIEIPVPKLSEQARIVEELDLLNGILDKKRQQLKELDALSQSIFYDMFGDIFVNNKNWSLLFLEDICSKITDGTHDTPERLTKGIKFITGKHIRPGFIDYDNSDYVTQEVHNEIYKRCNPEFGDVLYTNIGANLGTAAINIVEYEFSMKNVALLKTNYKRVNGFYLQSVLNTTKIKESIITNQANGGAQKFLSLKMIKKISIPVPPITLQNEFADKIKSIERQKQLIKASITETQTLLDSRMDYYFN